MTLCCLGFAVWVLLLVAFLLAFIFVVIIIGTSRSITASLHSPINSFAPALVADLLVATATTSFDSELQHVDWSPIAQQNPSYWPYLTPVTRFPTHNLKRKEQY
jgi:hypothetical protein